MFPGLCGLKTTRGLVTDRSLSGLYGAWRARELLGRQSRHGIVEIGAGLGWLALYAHRLGLRDYTIVDLPLTNVSQACFLGTVLGPDAISLAGEAHVPGRIRIEPADTTLPLAERYSLLVNVDSLTEVGRQVAKDYWARFAPRCDAVLSINHESNAFTVRELIAAGPKPFRVHRHPSWMRNGYVEEIAEMRPPGSV